MENQLEHLEQFKHILKDYKISDKGLDILRRSRLVLLVGPTSSGRNTIINKLADTGAYYHIVSDTTRKMRIKDGQPIEKNGREYWFRDESEVLADLKKGEYMEAAIIHNQQVSGCNLREVEQATKDQKIAIKDIETQGAETIHAVKQDAVIVFVVPPSFEEWRDRFYARGNVLPDEVRRRLKSSVAEFGTALYHDYYKFVVNDSVDHVTSLIRELVEQGIWDEALEDRAKTIAMQLQQEAVARLKELEKA